ncbi:MAG: sulfate respiration complex hexadecaheme cytochrome HmcA [Deltaproteobacteria bacterium]
MERSKYISKSSVMLGTVVAIFICAVGAEGLKTPASEPAVEARVDTIVIDTLARFGAKDKPPVPFPHDLHTEALAKQQKDCFTCHLKESVPASGSADQGSKPKERMSIKFKRLKDTTPREVRGIYHENCIGCHLTMADKGEKFGPVVCGECHKGTGGESARSPMGMDLSLHFRHSKAAEEACSTCHHAEDEGNEGTCRYCHKEKAEEDVISMPLASHLSCVECHREGREKNLKSGPITCRGCHDEKEQMKIRKVEPLPRMQRNQPDTIFVKALGEEEKETIIRMSPVPFDHKAHEEYNDTCRVCHHEEMAACNSCHPLTKADERGGNVQLERAMHGSAFPLSCVGCHKINQEAKECAGCHELMPTATQPKEETCLKCHMKPLPDSASVPQTPEAQAELAKRLLQSRVPVKGTYPAEEIPEKAVIKYLADKYEPVILPHRRIVLSIVERMNKSKQAGKLASYFHNDEATVCQGCHHNSPASAKPPSCVSCHSRPFDEANLMKPGLLGAYHQQCMGCHEAMEIKKPKECVECHKERKK